MRLIEDSESDGFICLLPSFDSKTPDLIVPAVMIAVVGFLETIAVGGKMANEKRYSYDANQELLALGAANCGGAFMGAFPITGGFSRTAVNAMFGASSPMAGALTSLIVVIAVYSLMPVVEVLPLSALAPLIIHGAIGVTDFKAFIPTFRGNKLDFLIMVATFVVSLGLTVKEGLITGVSLSILKLTYEVAMPNLAVCGQVEDGTFRDVRYLARKRNRGGILHVDIEYTYAYIYIYVYIYIDIHILVYIHNTIIWVAYVYLVVILIFWQDLVAIFVEHIIFSLILMFGEDDFSLTHIFPIVETTRYYPEGQMIPKCVVVRMDAGLSFANTRRLQEFCMRAINTASTADPSVSHLILDCKSINGTDMTGCEAIENLAISLEKRKKSLVLANLKAPLTQAGSLVSGPLPVL